MDYFTRKRVGDLAPQTNSQEGAAFLYWVVGEFPFPIAVIQWDGGSEFLGVFGLAIQELDMVCYFNQPHYPQGNGQIERSFRTDEEEFYQVEDLPADLGGFDDALQVWNRQVYERAGPQEALGHKTPEEFHQDRTKLIQLKRRYCQIYLDPAHQVDIGIAAVLSCSQCSCRR